MTATIKTTVIKDPSATVNNVTLSGDGSVAIGGTGFIKVPAGTTAQRPASANTGDLRFNTTTGLVECFDGTSWGELRFATNFFSINGEAVEISSTPYIISSYGLYQIETLHQFTRDVRIELWGGGGGGGYNNTPSRGGAGGYARGQFRPNVGDTFSAIVGRGGLIGSAAYPSAYPDGGGGYGAFGGGGGGSSRFGPQVTSGNENVTSNSFYLIAGGGGGGSSWISSGTPGGAGGGTNGMDGLGYYSSDGINCTGKGGTQIAGGAAATGGRITGYSVAGAKYSGGRGYGSGGGGGYYGGSGANGYYAMSGGGSGYLDTSTMSNTAMAQATSGSLTHYISPDPLGTRPGSAGYGGDTGSNVGFDGAIAIYLV